MRGWVIGMVLAGCGGTNVAPQAIAEPELVALEEQVRGIATGPCGSCHTGGLRTAKRDALEVFDLAEDRWAGRLETGQLDFFFDRISGDVTDADRAAVRRWVAGAKARR